MKKNKIEPKIKETKTLTNQEKVLQKIEELKKILSSVKSKFDKMDDKTKKRIAAGVAGSVALIAGAVSINKIKKACKNKK